MWPSWVEVLAAAQMASCGAFDDGVVVDTGVLACSRGQVLSYVTSLDVPRGHTKLCTVII